jgi:4-aminobutyrate aminotransferase/(S)-3-amino-2-methylpropionate transaminase
MDAPEVGGLGGTFGGNPLACAAGLAVLDVIEEEGLSARAMAIGEQVMACFADLESRHDWLTRSRGLGAMCGIEVVDPATDHADKARAARWVAAARERGLLLMTASGYVLRTLMPLVIGDDDLAEALQILRDSALAVENGKP